MIKLDIDKALTSIELKGSGDIIASEILMANFKLAELLARILNISVDHALLFMFQECTHVNNEGKERREAHD